MKREIFHDLHKAMNSMRTTDFLSPLPYGAAKKVLEVLEAVEGLILIEDFGACEIIGLCEHCETLLFDTDETETDESGDCTFCKKCADEWRAEQDKKLDQDIAAKATES